MESSSYLPPTHHPANQRTESDLRSELRHPSLFTNITVKTFFFPPRLFLRAERNAFSSDVKEKNLSPTVWRSSWKPICSFLLFFFAICVVVCFFGLLPQVLFAFDPPHLPKHTDIHTHRYTHTHLTAFYSFLLFVPSFILPVYTSYLSIFFLRLAV